VPTECTHFHNLRQSTDLRHAAEEGNSARGCCTAATGHKPGDSLSPRGSKPEEKGHKSNTPGGGVGPRDQGHGNHPSTSAKEKRRRWLGWLIFKGRSMKLLRKCVSLLKMTKTEGPNTGSFVKRAYSTKMDGMMILIMIPLLLMMLLPWQQNCRLSLGHNPTSHPSYPCMMGTWTQSNF
jgi:hypothetical protein